MPIAVITVLLLQLSGAIPQSSVGGPMTIAMVLFIAVLAVAIQRCMVAEGGASSGGS